MRNQNKKKNVDLNENNALLGPDGVELSSYIRVIARHYVRIDIRNWRVVPIELKNKIWDDLVRKLRII